MAIQIELPLEAIVNFCRRNQIRKLALFGSVLRADFRPDSDVDVLVEFEPEARVNFLMFVAMQEELGEILQREVDLHTPNSLSVYLRPKVLRTAKVIYERERQHSFA